MTLEISQIGCLNSFFNDKDKQNYLLNYFALEKGKKGKELERIINCVEEKTGIRLTKSFISKRFFDEKKKNLKLSMKKNQFNPKMKQMKEFLSFMKMLK